jgi:hypothetical protein
MIALCAVLCGGQGATHMAAFAVAKEPFLCGILDWLVTGGQIVPFNPAASVRGIVRQGKTPVLTPEEARALIDRRHRDHHACRVARPCADRTDGVQLRADRCRPPICCRSSTRSDDSGI